jgi:HK97 family phage portal protein
MGFFDIFKRPKEKATTVITQSPTGTAKWTPDNYEAFINETYRKNVVCYRSMVKIAEAVSMVPWRVYQKKGDEVELLKEHEAVNLIKSPNPEESFNFINYKKVIYMLAAGNSYTQKIVLDRNTIPSELWELRPDKVTIYCNDETGKKEGYYYNKETFFDIDPITGESNLLHVKLFDPLDDLYGMPPVKPTMREIDSANEATEWQKKMFENEGRPGMMFMSESELSDPQFDRLDKLIKENFSGALNAGKHMILEGGMKATAYNWSPKELDWINSNRELARKISFGYGVPPQLIGIPGDSTFANFEQARLFFWEDTIMWYLNLFRNEYNNWMFGENPDELFLNYDLNDIPAFIERRNTTFKMANEATFLRVNEKRQMTGYDDVDGGDVILINANQIPLSSADLENEIDEVDENEEKKMAEIIKLGYSKEDAKKMIGL